MAEAASPHDRSGGRRRGRRRSGERDDAFRCALCRSTVDVDAKGRCPLGHPVIDPDVLKVTDVAMDLREGSRPAPTTPPAAFSTPAPTATPRGGGHAAPSRHRGRHAAGVRGPAGAATPPGEEVVAVYSEPTAGLVRVQPSMDPQPTAHPSDEGSTPDPSPPDDHPAEEGLRLPTRLTRPLGPARETLQVLSEDLDDQLVQAHAANAAAFAAMVTAELPPTSPMVDQPRPAPDEDDQTTPSVGIPITDLPRDEPPASDALEPSVLADHPRGRARIGHDDLTPGATSSLDVGELPPPRAAEEPRFEPWPVGEDQDLEPPRTWGQRVMGALFLAALLALAWWLATSL